MVSILVYCHKKKEADILHELCGYCMALMGDEQLIYEVCSDENEFPVEKYSWDMLFLEINREADLRRIIKLREIFPHAILLLLTGQSVLPEQYVIPSVCPTMILRRPFDKQTAFSPVCHIFGYYYRQRDEESVQRLVIRSDDEKRFFRYTQILFLEAREKRLILYTDQEEIFFYGSLREMENILPEYFIRCHRSYIVNFMHITGLNFSKCDLRVREQFVIPISKTYKNKVKIQFEKYAGHRETKRNTDTGK